MPQDKLICSLWVNQPPSQVQLVQACGTADLNPYILNVTYMGEIVCQRHAPYLFDVKQECDLSGQLSNYRLNIVEENYQTSICSVATVENFPPSAEEIIRQCPDAKKQPYIVRAWGTRKLENKSLACRPPAVTQPVTIATSTTYHLLAAKLIWHGLVKADCPNGALLSPTSPTPCGLQAATGEMYNWQNGMDAQILASAARYNVSAATMKAIIAGETQFWPWTGTDGEHGIMQITEDGADLVMRMSLPGYDLMSREQKRNARIAWLKQLDCDGCTPQQSYDHAKQSMDLFAEALAAYWCTYGDWNLAIRAWNEKHGGLAQ